MSGMWIRKGCKRISNLGNVNLLTLCVIFCLALVSHTLTSRYLFQIKEVMVHCNWLNEFVVMFSWCEYGFHALLSSACENRLSWRQTPTHTPSFFFSFSHLIILNVPWKKNWLNVQASCIFSFFLPPSCQNQNRPKQCAAACVSSKHSFGYMGKREPALKTPFWPFS